MTARDGLKGLRYGHNTQGESRVAQAFWPALRAAGRADHQTRSVTNDTGKDSARTHCPSTAVGFAKSGQQSPL